jgi:hypothetical protein
MKNKLILLVITFMLFPLVFASTTFFDDQNEFFIMADFEEIPSIIPPVPPVTPTAPGAGGGRGSPSILTSCGNNSQCGLGGYCLEGNCANNDCEGDFDCIEDMFCFRDTCRLYECDVDDDCEGTESCWVNMCAKLFDMQIKEVQSPIYPGEFFNFTYFLKGVAEISGDVIVRFWLEQNGTIVTEGFDTIYLGDFDEKTDTSELFLPVTILPGTYNFYSEVEYDSYYARAGRVISVDLLTEEIARQRGITGAIVEPVPDRGLSYYIIPILIGLAIFVLARVIYLEKRRIREAFVYEEKFVKRHKTSILLTVFFVLAGGVIYYLDQVAIIDLPPLGISFVKSFKLFAWIVGAGLVILILAIFIRKFLRKRRMALPKKKLTKPIKKKKAVRPSKKVIPKIRKFVARKKSKRKNVLGEMKKNLAILKKKGYNTTELDYKLKFSNKKKMESLVNKSKKRNKKEVKKK